MTSDASIIRQPVLWLFKGNLPPLQGVGFQGFVVQAGKNILQGLGIIVAGKHKIQAPTMVDLAPLVSV